MTIYLPIDLLELHRLLLSYKRKFQPHNLVSIQTLVQSVRFPYREVDCCAAFVCG